MDGNQRAIEQGGRLRIRLILVEASERVERINTFLARLVDA